MQLRRDERAQRRRQTGEDLGFRPRAPAVLLGVCRAGGLDERGDRADDGRVEQPADNDEGGGGEGLGEGVGDDVAVADGRHGDEREIERAEVGGPPRVGRLDGGVRDRLER
eukprot:5102537-Prymnesium_polylepis.1